MSSGIERLRGVIPEFDPLFTRFQEALAGRYSLDRELGRGGMGVVYLGYEVRLQRPVAIKLLPPEMAVHAPLRERFLREARTAARLSHPNIVPVHAVDEIAGLVYYAMAYVPGETLAHRVARKPFAPVEATRVLREVAWALDYAHAQGVVHRDIKPENVILEQGSGRAMVTDFGIAAVEWDTRDTAPGQILGTPEFMSPEQAGGDEVVDGRSDLYSVGALGYYLLSGRPPFQGATAAKLLAQHLTAPVPSLAALAPETPEALVQILERCLAKDAGQRPASGAQLAEELGLVLQANPEPPAILRAFVRRTKWLALAPILPGLALAAEAFRAISAPTLVEVLARGAAGVAVGAAYLFYLLDSQIKQLSATGYGPRDMAEAADALARSQADEDTSLSRVTGWLSSPQGAKRGLWIALGVFLAEGLTMLLGFGAATVDYLIMAGSAVAAINQIMVLDGFRRPRKAKRSLTGRFWDSRFVAWRWTRLTGGSPEPSSATSHRPTELRLGQTVDELFAALPLDVRRQLPGLLPMVRRLEARTHLIRKRMEELDRVTAEAGRGGEAGSVLPDRAALLKDLAGSKVAADRHLEELVAALEIVRLDLLRLQASTATVEGITADLAAAAQIEARTEQLLAGRDEVDRLGREG